METQEGATLTAGKEHTLHEDAKKAMDIASAIYDSVSSFPDFGENVIVQFDDLFEVLGSIQAFTKTAKDESSFQLKQDDLQLWDKAGSGGFSSVYVAQLKGSTVAVKVLRRQKDESNSLFSNDRAHILEGRLLRSLSYDHIVAFRGMGQLSHAIPQDSYLKFDSQIFIVMEHIPGTLQSYVKARSSHESKGLSPSTVWDFAYQIALGLAYLHTLSEPLGAIAHRDLKPDNLLLNPANMTIKLADFGLALSDIYGGERGLFNVRWAAPEIWEDILIPHNEMLMGIYPSAEDDTVTNGDALQDQDSAENEDWIESSTEYFVSADVYAYGMVVAFCLTGMLPWGDGNSTATLQRSMKYDQKKAMIPLPKSSTDKDFLQMLITDCTKPKDAGRPSNAQDVVKEYFKGTSNPYLQDPATAEFFCCGFMKDTSIFVADSLLNEESLGYIKTGVYPSGYPEKCLVCEVDTNQEHGKIFPDVEQWDKEYMYNEVRQKFKKQAARQIIDDNPTVPLRYLETPREGEEEEQEVVMTFAQGTYVHHRAMREVWRSLSPEQKSKELPCKSKVHPVYSTSFGLHVAVITADATPRFLFCKRAMREGMSSPGKYTCGAVESVSVKDYVTFPDQKDKTYVSLLKTAARGLHEELRIEIKDSELSVICLSTIYLKHDTHEWGLCGFVDLSDKRIAPERRLTCEALRSRFTSGPKDKFEHDIVHDVDFTMDSMMKFVQENKNDFASSGKLVAVKVMQAFFGLHAVETAFSAAQASQ